MARDCPNQGSGPRGDRGPRRGGGDSGSYHSGNSLSNFHSGDSIPIKSGRGKRPFQSDGQFSMPKKEYPKVTPVESRFINKAKKGTKVKYPKRPDYGTAGRAIALIANHFPINFKGVTVYHYDIKIKPKNVQKEGDIGGGGGDEKKIEKSVCNDKKGKETVKGCSEEKEPKESKSKMRKLKQKETRTIFNEFVRQHPEHFAAKNPTAERKRANFIPFDGVQNFYTAVELKEEKFVQEFSMYLDGAEKEDEKGIFEGRLFECVIEVKLVQTIDMSQITSYYEGKITEDGVPKEALQVVDIIIRNGPTDRRIPIGRSLYPKSNERVNIDIGGNKHVGFGHYQAFHMTEAGPVLVVDRSATAFYTVTGSSLLIDYIRRIINFDPSRQANNDDFKLMKKHLVGLRVYSMHLPYKRSYTIKDISTVAADNQTFDFNGNKITVEEYFIDKYKDKLTDGRLQYKHLPCIIPQGGKKNFLPLELLHVYPDQPVPKIKIDPTNTSRMVRACGEQGPFDRFGEIQLAVNDIQNDSKNYLSEFQLDLQTNPIKVPGRVINKPQTDGLNTQQKQNKLLNPKALLKWAIFELSGQLKKDNVDDFWKRLIRDASSMGMAVSDPIRVQALDIGKAQNERDYFDNIFKNAKKTNCQMVMFILGDGNTFYQKIKYAGEINYGIVSQCIRANNLTKPGVVPKLLLKINTKLGGATRRVNDFPNRIAGNGQIPSTLKSPFMIIGADVTHPAPMDQLISSVAAVVGSYDKDHCQYATSISVQERSTKKNAVEKILKFDEMIGELLDVYHNKNNYYPKSILYYRDGVADSQFDQVLDHECKKIDEIYNRKKLPKPLITFIIVQKRHHTRFRPLIGDRNDSEGKKQNVPSGTVVDKLVTHPTDYDFFMTSQVGIQVTFLR